VGASFGDVDYVEVSPMIGYRLTPRFHTGVGVFYRWKNDDRYGVSVDTHDWGGSLFGQLQLFRGFFAHAEYEYVDYEYQTLTGTSSQSDTNTLAGLGFSRGGRAGVYGLALYNFSYDENDPTEAYDSPWVYRVGVSFGFGRTGAVRGASMIFVDRGFMLLLRCSGQLERHRRMARRCLRSMSGGTA
jgi:hypothetical protein